MSLLNSVLGAALGGGNQGGGIQGMLIKAVMNQVLGGGQQGGAGGLAGMVGSMLGGGQQQGAAGGLGDLLGGLLGGGNTQQAGSAAAGGLGNLTGMLSQLGLGDQVNSWVGTGENMPVSADQIQASLGQNGMLGKIAADAGVSETDAAGGLAELLPNLVNQLTPNGQIDANDIGSILGNLLGGNK